ncbi:MAG TPA: WGR domain-containing protein, partial [Bacteroidales bacterium]|nr:WGR domain-containing protein [Bacteroidales bacterium]
MSTLIREVKLIKAEAKVNSNKWWTGQLFDDGTVKATWGRVGYKGDSGQWNRGEKYFDKKIQEKLKKGYTYLKTIGNGNKEVSAGTSVKNKDLHSIARTQLVKSSSPKLERLIDQLVKSNIHRITQDTQITYSSKTGLFSTPMGIVTMEGIEEARNLLAKLSVHVRAQNYNKEADDLLNQYLRLIPQNIGMRKFDCETLIPGELSLQKQNDLLDALESSYMALTKSDSSNKSNSPQEKIFKVDLDILTDDSERRRLEKFFTSSKRKMHGYDKVKIREIYQVNIHEMTAAFESTLTPIVEVFHGTSQANCLSILKSGLKIRPPSTASIAGSMFGNGIYGAINSSKSLGYTFGRWGQGGVGESGWLFICKFA